MPARLIRRLPRWAIIAVALGVAGAVSAAAVVADAGVRGGSTPPSKTPKESWHVVDIYQGSGIQLQALAAVSSTDAWVAGSYGQSLTVRQWNGKTWRIVAAPPSFTLGPGGSSAVFDEALAASSAHDMWTFLQMEHDMGPLATYGLHWTGKSWTKYAFPAGVLPLSVADFGTADAWLFGQTQQHSAYAARWNGTIWRTVRAPGQLQLVSANGPDDLWGLTDTEVAHWTGTTWRTVPLPALPRLGPHASWQPTGIVALGAAKDKAKDKDNVWVSEVPAPPVAGGSIPTVGAALLHWNGAAWTVTTSAPPGVASGSLAYNGAGGFWLTVGEGDGMTNPADLLSYQNGRWSGQLAPTRNGYQDYSVYALSYIPATRSLWALADVLNQRTGQTNAAILKYGP